MVGFRRRSFLVPRPDRTRWSWESIGLMITAVGVGLTIITVLLVGTQRIHDRIGRVEERLSQRVAVLERLDDARNKNS